MLTKGFLAVAPKLGLDVLMRYPVSGSCPTHGDYAYESLVPPREGVCMCQECAKARCMQIDRQRQIDAREAALMPEALSLRVGTPRRYQTCSLENFRCEHKWQEIAHKAAHKLLMNIQSDLRGGYALTMYGPVGTGKTHLACALTHAAANMGYSARYATVHGLFSEYLSKDFADRRRLLATDVLVLDEVLRQTNEAMVEFVREVVEARYDSMLPIILLGNFQEKEMASALGTRCIDRLMGSSAALVNLHALAEGAEGSQRFA